MSIRSTREAGEQLGYDHTSLARYVREDREIGVYNDNITNQLVLIEIKILTPLKRKTK